MKNITFSDETLTRNSSVLFQVTNDPNLVKVLTGLPELRVGHTGTDHFHLQDGHVPLHLGLTEPAAETGAHQVTAAEALSC